MEIKIVPTQWYRVEEEKSVAQLSSRFNSDVILRNNPKLDLYSGEWVKFKVNNYKTHLVRPAQTLADIAQIYSISKEKLVKDNNLQSDKIFIGQRLKIF